jgi:SAM-dependent methyltransferase
MVWETVQGWFDFHNLYDAAVRRAADGDVLIEVGCWKGQSLCYLLEAAKTSGKTLRVYGIDHFRGSVSDPALAEEAGRADIHEQCLQNCLKTGYPFELVRQPSLTAAELFPNSLAAFVFIDAGHDHHSVVNDVRVWLLKVRPGGILAGHDFDRPVVRGAVLQVLPQARAVSPRSWSYHVPED